MLFRTLLLAVLTLALVAVDSAPVLVTGTTDGDTITVQGDVGEVPMSVRVRLLYVDTPEKRASSHGEAMPEGRLASEALSALLPIGSRVTLSAPGAELRPDGYGRLLAVVTRVEDGGRTNINAAMIRAGWSPYWRKYGDAPDPVHAELLAAQEAARADKSGAWTTAPKYMTDKANERTAPNGK